ncbi:LGFP repeat-containing protein [Nocardia sp. NPDC051570]|uniref:LGFP repeat-containing protein n=1 Tax=Nocardia sp. NPDC051570 TaxID=3364324 RepID=UPI00379B195A
MSDTPKPPVPEPNSTPPAAKTDPGKWAPTQKPNATVVPGKMRSDREQIPDGFSKAAADKAETMEAAVAARTTRSTRVKDGCQVYWPAPYEVCGAIRDKYNELGGPNGFLLFPKTEELTNPDGTGKRTEFQNGPIYWSPQGGAHPVVNHFLAAWARHGYEAGYIGYPTTDEIVNPDGVGRRQHFTGAVIYWKLNEAYSIGGAIFDKWGQTGWEQGWLGYPTSDETGTPDGAGRFNRFEKNGMIYWHSQFGAHPVAGGILDQWSTAGYEAGRYGYPVGDERGAGSRREQDFQNGKITWPTDAKDEEITEEVQIRELLSDAVTPKNLVHIYDGDGADPRQAPSAGQPGECVQGLKNISRQVSCSDQEGTITRYRIRNGAKTEIGKAWFVAKSWIKFSLSTRWATSPTWELGVRIETTKTEGELEKRPFDYVLSTFCESGTMCKTTSAKDDTRRELRAGTVVEYTWQQESTGPATKAVGRIDAMRGEIGAKMLHGPLPNPVSVELNNLDARCDSVEFKVGCVNDKALAGVGYNAQKNPKVTEVAQHVFDAQHSLPSHWGVYEVPVERTLDEGLRDANRAVACPDGWATLPDTCDEYPMATTYQGASKVAAGDWSRRKVSKGANDSQGGITGNAYLNARLMEKERFVVLAVLPDGRTSW